MSQQEMLLQQCHDLFANRQSKAALHILDELLLRYKSAGQWTTARHTLQELSEMYPQNVGLLKRLAALYAQLGYRAEALEQLDKLADIHHATSNFAGIVQTIRDIMNLQPRLSGA